MKINLPKHILVTAAAVNLFASARVTAQANLKPYAPSGWSSPVVVTTTKGSTTETTGLLATDTLYVDWCVINSGNQNVTTTFDVNLYVDGALADSETVTGGLNENYYEYWTGYSIGPLPAGTHKIVVIADPNDAVSNDNHSDNSYTNTISIGAVTLPAPALQSPVNGASGQPEVPRFSWSLVTNASSYRILIATSAFDLPSSPTATNGGASVLIDAVTSTNNFSPTVQLNPSTTYYWEVHARPGANDSGTWSAVESFTVGPLPNGLTIIPTFDSSITSDPQAATIEATINAAISVYRYDFSDQVTAQFTFTEMSSGLGDNNADYDIVNYSDYIAALRAQATTADDTNALAFLPLQTDNPVNGNSQVGLKLPLARALGFDSAPSPGSVDATVYLNTSVMNLSSTVTDPSKYSLFSTVSHEMDEALGFGSILNGVSNGDPPPTGPVFPQDLFRYDQNGNRTLSTALNALAYFSLNGTNDLAQFNQYDGGDFGDWYSYNVTVVPQVQDAFLAPGVNPILGVELRCLDVIGFTRVVSITNVPAQISAPVLSGKNFQFKVTGSSGSQCVIEVSSNLTTWVPLSTNTIPAGGLLSVTNSVGSNAHEFFRAVLQ